MWDYRAYLNRVYLLIDNYTRDSEYGYVRCLYGALLYCQPYPQQKWLAGPMYRKAIESLGDTGRELMFGNFADNDVRQKTMDLVYARMVAP